jgi:hypothetical protein
VIATVLGIIFKNEDRGVLPVLRMADKVDQPANGIVVVGHLKRRRIQSGNRCRGAPEVIMWETNETESRQTVDLHISEPVFAVFHQFASSVSTMITIRGELVEPPLPASINLVSRRCGVCSKARTGG